MRILIVSLLLLLAAAANSQTVPEAVQEAMQCMESIDQEAMEQLAAEGEMMADKIKALCKQGDEDGAKKIGVSYALEMMQHEVLLELQRCGEMMKQAVPSMEMPEMPDAETIKAEAESICDNL